MLLVKNSYFTHLFPNHLSLNIANSVQLTSWSPPEKHLQGEFDSPFYSLILWMISDWKSQPVLGEKRGKLFDKIINFRAETDDRKGGKILLPVLQLISRLWANKNLNFREESDEEDDPGLATRNCGKFSFGNSSKLFSHFQCHRWNSKCISYVDTRMTFSQEDIIMVKKHLSKYLLSPAHWFLPQTSAWPCPRGWKWYSGRCSW